jgi:rRNA-processing protein EBP2
VICPYILGLCVYQIQEEELRHEAKFTKVKGKGWKSQNVKTDDLALNDFRRETLFHRQAQAAVLIAIPKLRDQGVKTKRPDVYFAEMAKSDQHMQKVSIRVLLYHL